MIDDADVVITTVDDALQRGSDVLVLVGSEVMLLSPVSSEIVRACAGGLSIGELEEHLLAVFGPPPPGSSAGEQARMLIEDLRAAGVVRLAAHHDPVPGAPH